MKENNVKYILTGLLALGLSTHALTDHLSFDETSFSGDINYASDYIFRGVSQAGKPVVSVSAVVSDLPAGAYVGVWSSDVDFSRDGDSETTREVDFFGGFVTQIADNLTVDLGYIRYQYDGIVDDIEEVYAVVNWGNLTLSNYTDTNTHDNYAEVGYSFGWLFGDAFDVSFIYGLYDEDDTFTMLSASKNFGSSDQWTFGVLIGEDVLDGQASNSIHASINYNFGFTRG